MYFYGCQVIYTGDVLREKDSPYLLGIDMVNWPFEYL